MPFTVHQTKLSNATDTVIYTNENDLNAIVFAAYVSNIGGVETNVSVLLDTNEATTILLNNVPLPTQASLTLEKVVVPPGCKIKAKLAESITTAHFTLSILYTR